MSRGRGGPRFPSAAAPHGDGWQGSRTPMAAADSSRTPAWGGASSARSKYCSLPSFVRSSDADGLQLLLGVVLVVRARLHGRWTDLVRPTPTMEVAPPTEEPVVGHPRGTPARALRTTPGPHRPALMRLRLVPVRPLGEEQQTPVGVPRHGRREAHRRMLATETIDLSTRQLPGRTFPPRHPVRTPAHPLRRRRHLHLGLGRTVLQPPRRTTRPLQEVHSREAATTHLHLLRLTVDRMMRLLRRWAAWPPRREPELMTRMTVGRDMTKAHRVRDRGVSLDSCVFLLDETLRQSTICL